MGMKNQVFLLCCLKLVLHTRAYHSTFSFQVKRGHQDVVMAQQNSQPKGRKFCSRMNGTYRSFPTPTCICRGRKPIFTSTQSGRPICSNRRNFRSLSCVSDSFQPVLCMAESKRFTSRVAFRNVNHEHCTQFHVWNIMERHPPPTNSPTLPRNRKWRNRTPYAEAATRGAPWVGGWVNASSAVVMESLKVKEIEDGLWLYINATLDMDLWQGHLIKIRCANGRVHQDILIKIKGTITYPFDMNKFFKQPSLTPLHHTAEPYGESPMGLLTAIVVGFFLSGAIVLPLMLWVYRQRGVHNQRGDNNDSRRGSTDIVYQSFVGETQNLDDSILPEQFAEIPPTPQTPDSIPDYQDVAAPTKGFSSNTDDQSSNLINDSEK